MQSAATVLDVLRERGRRGLPCDELYRQLFNPHLYLLAYGRLYSNDGAMTPGADGETVDDMSLGKIGRIIDALRCERYRFTPVKRVYIEKKNGKLRPLGLPSWSDKLVGEVIRLLLEAYYEPQFSGRSHGFRPGRGCHTALTEVAVNWTGTTWFIEGDISGCLDPWSYCSFADFRAQKSPSWGAGTSIRRPFLRPVRVRTARSSPRLTFCNTVWRETPRAWVA
jgi:Reverse transcriptase (RNA-dependent DNA polymerase)